MCGVVTRCPDAGLHPTAQMSLPWQGFTQDVAENTQHVHRVLQQCARRKKKRESQSLQELSFSWFSFQEFQKFILMIGIFPFLHSDIEPPLAVWLSDQTNIILR